MPGNNKKAAMKKFIMLLVFGMMFAGIATSSTADNKSVVGTWNYTVSTAPEGLTKGEVVIKETDGVLTGKVIFQDGNSIDLKNVKYEGTELSFNLYVESEYVSVKAKINGKKMEGQVNTSEGPMNFVAELAEMK